MRTLALFALAACSFQGNARPDGGTRDASDPDLDGGIDGRVDDAPLDGPPVQHDRTITIPNAVVTGMLPEFPVWIDIVIPTANGDDIYFLAADGTLLAFEVQRWDSAARRLQAWVRTDIDGSKDNVIHVRYGTPRPILPAATAVWSAGFAAVWHFEDALTTTAIKDSTAMRDGTTVGNALAKTATTLGGGIAFDGNGDHIAFTNPLLGTGAHTISAWVDLKATTTTDAIVMVGTPTLNAARWLHAFWTNQSSVAAGFYSNDVVLTTATDIRNGGPHLVHWSYEGMNRKTKLFVDGVAIASYTLPSGNGQPTTVGATGYIGKASEPEFGTNTGLNGILDEVRIATLRRTDDWVLAEFANQSSPGTFALLGPELDVP